jgi:hypothetical protein
MALCLGRSANVDWRADRRRTIRMLGSSHEKKCRPKGLSGDSLQIAGSRQAAVHPAGRRSPMCALGDLGFSQSVAWSVERAPCAQGLCRRVAWRDAGHACGGRGEVACVLAGLCACARAMQSNKGFGFNRLGKRDYCAVPGGRNPTVSHVGNRECLAMYRSYMWRAG